MTDAGGPSDRGRASRYVLQPAGYRAFVPAPLPPRPPMRMTRVIQARLSAADRALGRLDGAVHTLPEADLFVLMYVRKEAVLSSQIEGAQSSLRDVLAAEARLLPPRGAGDAREVINYVTAMNHGLERLPGLPPSVRLIRESRRRPPASGPDRLGPCPVRDDPPLLDGNGRVGRLLIAFFLCERKILRPGLY